ncbi:MAG: LCP family protein [Solirubrobacteraceae bacterium]|nr:LCP family protein [Solirubrobacteraceae bacterium]
MQPTARHWPQYLGAFAVLILLAGVASASAALLQLQQVTDTFNELSVDIDKGAQDQLADVQAGRPQTILLIGSDKRSKKAADGGRSGALSDTLMLARLDPDSGATAVLSIPRDTKAQIPLKGGGFRTAKINEAFADGGEELTIKTVRELLGLPINHVVIVNFNAFQRAVNYLGGLYQDIDHRFFNDNSQGGDRYATIDVHAGYQLMKGSDTLDWVRFRHQDSDLVRAARQQEFLRSAKNQVAASELVKNRNDLLRIFALYTQTDIDDPAAILGVLKLALNSAKQPVRSVRFRADEQPGTTFLTVSDANLELMRREFTQLKAASGAVTPSDTVKKARKTTKKVKRKGLATGLIPTASDVSRTDLAGASFNLAGQLPVYYPSARLGKGGWAEVEPVRTYKIGTRVKGQTFPAYRLSYYYGENGQYWGVQGLTWRNPPILRDAHSDVQRNGRKLTVYRTGSRYRLVSWRTAKGVYWVSNTVSNLLTNAQMLDIAANLKRVPG